MEDMKKKTEQMSDLDYIQYVVKNKKSFGMTWDDIQDLLNEELCTCHSESYYRKNFGKFIDEEDAKTSDSSIKSVLEQEMDKVKLSDVRVQWNACMRRLQREDTIREIAREYADTMQQSVPLDYTMTCQPIQSDCEQILEISDWHYGMECDNPWNTYNPDVAKQRVKKLVQSVKDKCKKHNVSCLHVVNLSDLIAGRIHLPLRLESRFDVITQVMEVSEILASVIYELQKIVPIKYYDCLDNHSRLEPNKKDSLDLESLVRIIHWYIKDRFQAFDNVEVEENYYGQDVITFTSMGHSIVGVHGHHDSPSKVIDNMSLMTHKHYEIVLSAHLHHFSCDEKNETVLVSNGSLMGTDSYATNLRLSSVPSQNLIIVTEDNPVEQIYRITLKDV